ncbi:Ig-like domain-containing protein, partial [Paenibacillus sp. TAF58]
TTPGAYPTSSYNQSNYYVDAVFTSTDTSPLAASGQWPLPGSSSVPTSTTIGAVFSKPVVSSTIVFTVKDQLGTTVPGTVSYTAATNTATFTPTSALNGFVTYSVALTAKDTTGLTLSSGQSWSFTTVKPAAPDGTCPCGLFTDATTPSVVQVSEEPVT